MAKPTPEMREKFQKNISYFPKISPENIFVQLSQSQTIWIFMGKESCSYCRAFAEKLAIVWENHLNHSNQNPNPNPNIYFVDSSDKLTLLTLKSFREKYRIPTVPALLKIKMRSDCDDVNVQAICNSKMSLDEIRDFLELG